MIGYVNDNGVIQPVTFVYNDNGNIVREHQVRTIAKNVNGTIVEFPKLQSCTVNLNRASFGTNYCNKKSFMTRMQPNYRRNNGFTSKWTDYISSNPNDLDCIYTPHHSLRIPKNGDIWVEQMIAPTNRFTVCYDFELLPDGNNTYRDGLLFSLTADAGATGFDLWVINGGANFAIRQSNRNNNLVTFSNTGRVHISLVYDPSIGINTKFYKNGVWVGGASASNIRTGGIIKVNTSRIFNTEIYGIQFWNEPINDVDIDTVYKFHNS